jgi:hypothetical protein
MNHSVGAIPLIHHSMADRAYIARDASKFRRVRIDRNPILDKRHFVHAADGMI